jgi:hypothetical protein
VCVRLYAQKQNVQSIGALNQLLAAGGQVIWVAPSGGRDRPNPADMSRFTVADFDLKTIEMFKMLGMQSSKVRGASVRKQTIFCEIVHVDGSIIG